MAEASISVDQDQFMCPVCLDLLKDPVTVPCGHSFCVVCINGCWDQEDQKGVYTCPQCREIFTRRPVLRRNNMLSDVVEKVKKTELRAPAPAPRYAGPGDVECDFCSGRKHKAIKSCVTCQASFCGAHLQPHYDVPGLKKHRLVKASSRLQERVCSQHDRLMEIYCRTDRRCICELCTMDEHRGHDTVEAAAERTEKQSQLEEVQRRTQQRIQEKQKELREMKEAVSDIKRSAQAAVEDSERVFTELLRSIEKKRSEMTKQIRAQEKAQLSGAEEHLEKLEEEISDLKKRRTELEQLSHSDDHISFLQSFQSLCVSAGRKASPSAPVPRPLSLDGVRRSVAELKEQVEDVCKFRKVSPRAAAVQRTLPIQPKAREDFLQYFHRLTLDPNTANHDLVLSEENRAVRWSGVQRRYPDHPERFDYWNQALCVESVRGRCYWEVEWERKRGSWVGVSVSYRGIGRKGESEECVFGRNALSWSLLCSSVYSFWHNNVETKLSGPSSNRIGVYVDHDAGILSFYDVSDTMTLLHSVHTTFTQPLYAGLRVSGVAKLSDVK
ncbi:E3 ubiquitin/ISG15 ligase TRIM25-like [Hoplias malabaricus]|uniref:E3 ubiquitin/ISG15 ligase TRIM25-like n=1 Tax=Hoplias malabaricus TaxID=27720 RepID=UPI0034625592